MEVDAGVAVTERERDDPCEVAHEHRFDDFLLLLPDRIRLRIDQARIRRQRPAREHHREAPRVGARGEKFRVAWEVIAGELPAFLGDLGGDDGAEAIRDGLLRLRRAGPRVGRA